MIRIAKISLLIAGLTWGLAAQAQEVFKVLAFKGTGSYTEAGKENRLVTGSKLGKDAVIKLGADSYAGLVHKSGKSKELKTAGTYKVADLDKEITASSKSTSEKYAEYVMTELTKTSGAGNRGDKMTVTGSVERGSDEAGVRALSPASAEVVRGDVMLAWETLENVDAYVVTVLNMYEEPVFSKTVEGSSIVVDLSSEKLKSEDALIWNVSSAQDASVKSSNLALKFLDAQKSASITAELQELKKELAADSPINSLIMGAFYEKNGLIINALQEYKKAMEMAPGVGEFEKVYQNFLLRNGMLGR